VSDGAASFRKWLFARLLGSSFATEGISDDRIDAVAKQIGVDPDLLVEVRTEARLGQHRRGLSLAHGRFIRASPQDRHMRIYQYHLFMPGPVYRAWQEELEFRGVPGTVLLRSLLHDYLQSRRDVGALASWIWDGNTYKLGKLTRKDFEQRTVIPHGAKRALARRAAAAGTTSTAITRALVLEALRGLHRDILLVDPGAMYDDENRYYLGVDPGA